MDDLPELPYTAIKEDGKWKIIIQAMEIDMSPESPQPGKITIKSNKWENATVSTVTPDTSALWVDTGKMVRIVNQEIVSINSSAKL